MDKIYMAKMSEIGYDHLVCDIFGNWETVKDELLVSDRKVGTGNGTVHVFLGAADDKLQKEFQDYYADVNSGIDPSIGAIKVTHYFMYSNIVSMLGHVCQYFYNKGENIEPHIKNVMDRLLQYPNKQGLYSTYSVLKLSLGASKLRPYFKQFDQQGVFAKIIRPILLPNTSYKISIFKNPKGEYAAFWLIGFNGLNDYEVDSNYNHIIPFRHAIISNTSYRPYITAIKSKPFLLLAGISGTGKSRIVRELARACWEEGSAEYKAHKPRNFEMVQVKPNWHDSSELLGYVSRIGADKDGNGVTFVAGDFLKFIARAWEEQDVPYFLCLDEMNLAPVEQYFAEYLSVVESRKATSEGVVTDPIQRKSIEPWYFNLCAELTSDDDLRQQFLNDGICIPQNLIVIGTVNMDETTFSFSRKVLDRAMTIEMNEVDLYGGLTERHERIGKLGTAELVGTCVEGVDVYNAHRDVCDKVIAYLKVVNDKLEGTPFKIAYRTRNEFLLYVVNNLPYNMDEDGEDMDQGFVIARALDEITNMKILSRIEGDETKVSEKFLKGLSDTIKEQLEMVFDGPFGIEETDDTCKSLSLAKLDEMIKKLSSGYTSFWS